MSATGWKGIRRHGHGWQAEVRVTGHPRSVQQWPIDTDPAVMQDWRKKEKARLQLTAARASKGTFAADAKRYLDLVQDMPSFASRKRDIELWIGVFGTRPRASITRADIRLQRDRWHREGPRRIWRKHPDGRRGGAWVDVPGPLAASTVNHRLRALSNLYTELDGRRAPNPAREVSELEEDAATDRSLPYALIEMILAAMPDHRYRRKLTEAQTRAIRLALHAPAPNLSALARAHGVSETMIRKIRDGKDTDRRDSLSKTKARLRLMAYTGLSQAEIARLEPHQVHIAEGWIDTGRRRKGKGVRTGKRPLSPLGVEALRGFIDAAAFGPFSRASMAASFRRGVDKVIRTLGTDPAAAAIVAQLRRLRLRPYDLRHSFVTEVLDKSGDLHATQLLTGHADLRTTLGYASRALNPALRAALERVHQRGGFGVTKAG